MRLVFFIFLIFFVADSMAQQTDSVTIPKRVVYKYADPGIVEKAKQLINRELTDSATYMLDNGIVFIGPILWKRYSKIPALEAIPGGNVTILYNKEKLAGKITQDKEGFKKVWNQVITEVKTNGFKLRKATYNELDYYWSVISFDIEEPLLIAETSEHRFIINLSPKNLKLLWLDEVPVNVK